ncbi:MAG: iron ABC transporter permease, partial [Bradyrhizobium sp.]
MSGDILISRRALATGAVFLGLGLKAASAQGFGELGADVKGFSLVLPGKSFAFPADHGPHPDFRIEWWY